MGGRGTRPVRPDRHHRRRRVPGAGSRRYADEHPDAEWIVGERLVDGELPRRRPDAGPARRDRARPARLPDQPRPPRRLGQQPRPGPRRHHRRAPPTRPTGAINRDADGDPAGRCRRARSPLVGRLVPTVTPGGPARRAAARAGGCCTRCGITAWQDAIARRHARLPGPADAYLHGRPTDGSLTATRRRRAVVGPRARRRADPRPGRPARPVHAAAGSRCGTVKIMQDGDRGELHRRDDRAVPRRAAATRPPTAASASSTRRRCGSTSPRWTRWASRSTSTPSATARSGRRSTRSKPPARANGFRDTRPHLAHLQVVHPDDVPRFRAARRDREHPAAVGRARTADGRADHPVPRPRARPAGSTRSVTCSAPAPPSPPAATGRSAAPDPLQGIHVAVNRRLPGAAHAAPFLPEQRLDLGTALAAYTAGSAYVNHLDDTGTPARRQRGRPRRPRPRPVRRPDPTRSATPASR